MFVVDKKYKIALVGSYNPSIYICPECNHNILTEFVNNIIGFADSAIGLMVVLECPKCFDKYYCHADEEMYWMFLESIETGKNKHFK